MNQSQRLALAEKRAESREALWLLASARRSEALEIAERFGGIDGEHHKSWVIDQMVRALLGDEGYTEWLKQQNEDPDYDPWDHGIAP